MKANSGDHSACNEKMGLWVDLCETFEAKQPETIKEDFEAMNIPAVSAALGEQKSVRSIDDSMEELAQAAAAAEPEGIYTGSFLEGRRHGEGRCTFDDGRVFTGQWVKGKIQGTG